MGKLSNAVIELGSKVTGKAPQGKGLTALLEDFAKNYRLEVADMKTLTHAQCEGLACGGVVVKSESNGEKHAYIVSYKKDKAGSKKEMSLTYSDHSNVEEVYYEDDGTGWKHIITETTHIGQ